MTVKEIEQLLEKRRKEDYTAKYKELIAARHKVKELEAYLKIRRAHRKYGGVKADVLSCLSHGPRSLKSIVTATGAKYGTVSALLMKLQKKKIVIKDSEYGGAYTLVKNFMDKIDPESF